MGRDEVLEVKLNAANLDVSGSKNPNWKGGLVNKNCVECGSSYSTKPGYNKSKFCSMKCVGSSQKGKNKQRPNSSITKTCEVCQADFTIPKSHDKRQMCCSKQCSYQRRSLLTTGEKNVAWNGGLSRFPYPYDWLKISKNIRERDGDICQNPKCTNSEGKGKIEVHHIDYDKMNCLPNNLITLCTVCNTKANFGRLKWKDYYTDLLCKLLK